MIFEVLRKRYPEGEYALLSEVSDAAGFSRSRSADYMVINLWPSRGLHLSGIELKSHRSDWLRELKNPGKAENIFKYCDFFWLLTESEDVAKIEEIPASWGWMTLKGKKIHVVKDAPKLNPAPISRSFLAALLKRASSRDEWVHKSDIEDRINSAREHGKLLAESQHRRDQQDLQEIQNQVKAFEQASGIDLKIGRWPSLDNSKRVGEIVNYLANRGGISEIRKEFERMESVARKLHDRIADGLKLITEKQEG